MDAPVVYTKEFQIIVVMKDMSQGHKPTSNLIFIGFIKVSPTFGKILRNKGFYLLFFLCELF